MLDRNYLNYGLKFFSILLFLTLFRVILVSYNEVLFSDFSLYHYYVGFLFDVITCALFYLPFIVCSLMPITKFRRIQSNVSSMLFVATTAVLFLLNTIDIAYVGFVKKRITADFLMYVCFHSESEYSIGLILMEFWWLLLLLVFTLAAIVYIEKKTFIVRQGNLNWKSWMSYLLVIFFFVLVGRGGFTLRPIGIIESYKWVKSENAVGVLNSGFTFIKTITSIDNDVVDYMSRQEEKQYFNPIVKTVPRDFLTEKNNVVFVVLESFSSYYTGPNCSNSYSPFLDSILTESMYFENGVSNAQTSIDALPILLSSVPNFSKQSLILSGYQLNGLPGYLRSHGYGSLFFHGAKNGSMRFDSFSKSIGFDNYFGMNEYPYSAHYDGSWGIWDHEFLPWTISKMNKAKEPFVSCIYTLSSHHPFKVPSEFEYLNGGPDKICKTIQYTDEALRIFWKEVKRQKWFDRTLFVFCADHTGPTNQKKNMKIENRYRIPIAFYHPKVNLSKYSSELPFQQLDILPTLLELLNIEEEIYTYGNSFFNTNEKVNFNFSDGRFYLFSENNAPELILLGDDMLRKEHKILTAMYQRFQYDLLENKMRWKY